MHLHSEPLFVCLDGTKLDALKPSEIVEKVDGRRGCVVKVFKAEDFEEVTPRVLRLRSEAKKWAKKVISLWKD